MSDNRTKYLMKTIVNISAPEVPTPKVYSFEEAKEKGGIFKSTDVFTPNSRFIFVMGGEFYIDSDRTIKSISSAWKNDSFIEVQEKIVVEFDNLGN